jgi:hypothetical protein
MTIDRYTKSLLTLITLCLIFICLKDAFHVQPVMASPQRTPGGTVRTYLLNSSDLKYGKTVSGDVVGFSCTMPADSKTECYVVTQ